MKLLSVRILGNEGFKSLNANETYSFGVSSLSSDQITTKIFAGINGSGKSNFLELLSDIFCFLEIYHLQETPKEEKAHGKIGFEIEYLISLPLTFIEKHFPDPVDGQYIQVRISKPLGLVPEFSIKRLSDNEYFTTVNNETGKLLPARIVAYTSGQNEQLSDAYYKLKYHYIQNYRKAEVQSENDTHRMIFLDTCINSSVFVANTLLAEPYKLNYLLGILKIENLHSFRITINLTDEKNRPVDFPESILNSINKLKKCTTTWIERKMNKRHLYILDYWVNDATQDAFRFYFKSSFELFKAFYDLENLNLLLLGEKERERILKVDKLFNFTDDLPKNNPYHLIFRIENIQVRKTIEGKPSKVIPYRSLSDGEHQFNEVIGTILMMEEDNCLFLMDEPDTHFNPKWRAKMIKMLNYVSALEIDANHKVTKVRDQEIIITTHSPFVVSDTRKEDVYVFEKDEKGAKYHNPEIETYGASINLILQEVFRRDITISDYAYTEMKELKKDIASSKKVKELYDARSEVFKFGESIEKFDLYNLLSIKEREIKQKG